MLNDLFENVNKTKLRGSLIAFSLVALVLGVCTVWLSAIGFFLVSLLAIKLLMDFVKRHDFSVFGIYRIVLGIAVVTYFLATR